MKKFEKHEKYPDPIVRAWIDIQLGMGYSKEQYNSLAINAMQKLKEVKKELKIGIQMLFEAKEQVCKSLMSMDLFKKNFLFKTWNKEQMISILEMFKNVDIKVSNEAVFDLTRENIKFTQRLDIPDPKLLSIVHSKANGSVETPSSLLTHAFSATYNMTLVRCC